MATTKTFKTRIKLKYDSAANWHPEGGSKFPGLAGELLIGSDDKYLRIGNGSGWDWAEIMGSNVDITPIIISDNTASNADSAISLLATKTSANITAIGQNTSVITDHGTRIAALEAAVGEGGTVSTQITDAINALDKTVTGTGASQTLATLTQENGVIDATFQPISIISSQVTDFATSVKSLIVTGETEGTIKVNGAEVAVAGLGSAAYTDSGAYATAAQGAIADTAVQTITGDENVIATRTEGSNVVILSHKTVNPTDNNGEAITVGIGESKEISIPFISFDTTGHIENRGTQKVTITIPDANDLGLSNALHFLGVTTTALTDGNTTTSITIGEQSVTAVNGDVVLYNQKEFVFDGTTWHELGDASANTTAISEINDKIADMDFGLTCAANKTITALTQVDGKITAATASAIDIPTSQVTSLEGYTIATNSGALETDDTLNQALGKLEKNISINKESITTLTGDENTAGSVLNTVKSKINALDGSATIATVANDVVTLKADITETNGVISNTTASDITLAKVAKTGAAVDVSITDSGDSITATNVEDALTEIVGKVNTNATAISNLHQVARSGKISDLEQAETTTTGGFTNTDDMIIFDCGSATENTLPEANA